MTKDTGPWRKTSVIEQVIVWVLILAPIAFIIWANHSAVNR